MKVQTAPVVKGLENVADRYGIANPFNQTTFLVQGHDAICADSWSTAVSKGFMTARKCVTHGVAVAVTQNWHEGAC